MSTGDPVCQHGRWMMTCTACNGTSGSPSQPVLDPCPVDLNAREGVAKLEHRVAVLEGLVDDIWKLQNGDGVRLEKLETVTHPSPPSVCTGSGTLAPAYQGVTASTSTGWEPTHCGICGQVVHVDGYKRCVTHPYREITTT